MSIALSQILEILREEADPGVVKGMARFGVAPAKAFGIRIPVLRKLARDIGRDQHLAEELWNDPHHESKLLATMIAEPEKFSIAEADRWVKDLYSWDVCDQFCNNLLAKTRYAWQLPGRWALLEPEFERRAGLVMIAVMAVHHKKVDDEQFLQFIPLLKSCATDPRNFVKKAVNWAIRQMGKRSSILHPHMISLCHELLEMNSKPASWIARDALRELERSLELGIGSRESGVGNRCREGSHAKPQSREEMRSRV